MCFNDSGSCLLVKSMCCSVGSHVQKHTIGQITHTQEHIDDDSLQIVLHTALPVYRLHVFFLKLMLLSNCFSNGTPLKRRTVVQWLEFYHWFPIGPSIHLSAKGRERKSALRLSHLSSYCVSTLTHVHAHRTFSLLCMRTHSLSFEYRPCPKAFCYLIQYNTYRSIEAKETPHSSKHTPDCMKPIGRCYLQ